MDNLACIRRCLRLGEYRLLFDLLLYGHLLRNGRIREVVLEGSNRHLTCIYNEVPVLTGWLLKCVLLHYVCEISLAIANAKGLKTKSA